MWIYFFPLAGWWNLLMVCWLSSFFLSASSTEVLYKRHEIGFIHLGILSLQSSSLTFKKFFHASHFFVLTLFFFFSFFDKLEIKIEALSLCYFFFFQTCHNIFFFWKNFFVVVCFFYAACFPWQLSCTNTYLFNTVISRVFCNVVILWAFTMKLR